MKSSKAYITTVVVTGTGRFPIDMLRYDRCVPASSEDAGKIERVTFRDGDAVHVTLKRYSLNPDLPTMARWQSFLWDVTLVTDEAGKVLHQVRAAKASMKKLAKVISLYDLSQKAKADPAYEKLAMTAAHNLGKKCNTLSEALQWLNTNANETDEEGVVNEVNGVRDLVP